MKFVRPDFKEKFSHQKDIDIIRKVTKEEFGETPEFTIIGFNRIFRIDLKNRTMKVVIVHKNEKIHQMLQDHGIRVPKLIKSVDVPGYWSLRYIKWIDGFTYEDQMINPDVYKKIPVDYYYQMGKILAQISNIKFAENKYLGMSDIYWKNFIVKDDIVYLTDIKKVFMSNFPEHFLILQILMHSPTPFKHRERLMDGFCEVYNFKWKNDGYRLMKRLVEGYYEKLGEL